jgi:hypothetical protein
MDYSKCFKLATPEKGIHVVLFQTPNQSAGHAQPRTKVLGNYLRLRRCIATFRLSRIYRNLSENVQRPNRKCAATQQQNCPGRSELGQVGPRRQRTYNQMHRKLGITQSGSD